jgi:hypothetical protein
MATQWYNWTCSVCSVTWALNAMGLTHLSREEVGVTMGYPNCVNETYGCMSSDCVAGTFAAYGYNTRRAYCTFDNAFAIMSQTTGTINPQGMYHFMGIRGVRGGGLWVANSAPGYRGVWDDLSRSAFNSLGPVELIYVV